MFFSTFCYTIVFWIQNLCFFSLHSAISMQIAANSFKNVQLSYSINYYVQFTLKFRGFIIFLMIFKNFCYKIYTLWVYQLFNKNITVYIFIWLQKSWNFQLFFFLQILINSSPNYFAVVSKILEYSSI